MQIKSGSAPVLRRSLILGIPSRRPGTRYEIIYKSWFYTGFHIKLTPMLMPYLTLAEYYTNKSKGRCPYISLIPSSSSDWQDTNTPR